MNDSLSVLAARLALFQATATGEFDAMGQQVIKVEALLGQNTRNVQEARAQLQAVREQGGNGGDVRAGHHAERHHDRRYGQRAAASGVPGPATLFTSAVEEYRKGSYRTARSGFEQLITNYPDYDQNAARAVLHRRCVQDRGEHRGSGLGISARRDEISKQPGRSRRTVASRSHALGRQQEGRSADRSQSADHRDYPNPTKPHSPRTF